MIIELFQKNSKQQCQRHTFLKKTTEVLRFITLPLETLYKTKLYPCKFQEIVLHLPEIPRPKMKTLGNSI